MKTNCTFLITCFTLFPFICFSQEKPLVEKLVIQYKSDIFYPVMSYESAYIEGGHKLGLHLPDYMAFGSLKYNYADSANYSITLGLCLPGWQVGFQKHLFSAWNHPVNLKLSAGFFLAGIWADLKLVNGIYIGERSNLSGILTYGKYWAGLGPVNFTDEKYIQFDLYYLIKTHQYFSIGFGGGSSIYYYNDYRDAQDTKDTVHPGAQTRVTWQGALNLLYSF